MQTGNRRRRRESGGGEHAAEGARVCHMTEPTKTGKLVKRRGEEVMEALRLRAEAAGRLRQRPEGGGSYRTLQLKQAPCPPQPRRAPPLDEWRIPNHHVSVDQ